MSLARIGQTLCYGLDMFPSQWPRYLDQRYMIVPGDGLATPDIPNGSEILVIEFDFDWSPKTFLDCSTLTKTFSVLSNGVALPDWIKLDTTTTPKRILVATNNVGNVGNI